MATATILKNRTLKFHRLSTQRISRETLLTYAQYLPELPRALLTAHLQLGMNAKELALLHQVTSRQMRRRLEHLREALADPYFLLVAQYGSRLPEEFASLARGFWIEGFTLRELARRHNTKLHSIRTQLATTRSLLLIHLSTRQTITGDQACTALCQ